MPPAITDSQNVDGFCVTNIGRNTKAATAQADRERGAGDEEVGDRARIENAGLDQPAPQDLGVASLLGRIVLGRVVEQALNGLHAGAAQRMLLVGFALAAVLRDAGGAALDRVARMRPPP